MSAALSLPQKFARGSFLHSHKNIYVAQESRKHRSFLPALGLVIGPYMQISRGFLNIAMNSWEQKLGPRPPTCRRYDNTVYITRTIDGIKNHHWCIL